MLITYMKGCSLSALEIIFKTPPLSFIFASDFWRTVPCTVAGRYLEATLGKKPSFGMSSLFHIAQKKYFVRVEILTAKTIWGEFTLSCCKSWWFTSAVPGVLTFGGLSGPSLPGDTASSSWSTFLFVSSLLLCSSCSSFSAWLQCCQARKHQRRSLRRLCSTASWVFLDEKALGL